MRLRFLPVPLLVVVVAVSACANVHFETVVEIAASKHPRTCDGRFTLKKLSGWAYRVDACEGTLYYRCGYARKTMGRTQCCNLVEDESAATALFSTEGANPTCVAFVD